MKRTVAAGASALLLLVTLACGQQTWDAAMQAGETALQRGQYEQAEKFSLPPCIRQKSSAYMIGGLR